MNTLVTLLMSCWLLLLGTHSGHLHVPLESLPGCGCNFAIESKSFVLCVVNRHQQVVSSDREPV